MPREAMAPCKTHLHGPLAIEEMEPNVGDLIALDGVVVERGEEEEEGS